MPNLYKGEFEIKDELVEEKELYLIHFPLGAALWHKIVKKVGNYPIPQDFILPSKFRTEHIIRDEFICWHIVDYDTWKRESVKELSDEQKELSPWGIWNATLLKKRLAEGWTLDKWL